MITKRTQNAAHIRYMIISYVLESCKLKDFEKIHVSDICKASKISKVTFFKYFEHKNEVLLLYKSIINYGLCIEVSKRNLHGVQGLEFVIDRYAQIVRETPSLARELVSSILDSKQPMLPFKLTEADKAIFFPDLNMDKVSILPFWSLIEGFMLEGILSKAIVRYSNAADLASLFISSLYGAIITSHIRGQEQKAVYFNNVLRNWLRSL